MTVSDSSFPVPWHLGQDGSGAFVGAVSRLIRLDGSDGASTSRVVPQAPIWRGGDDALYQLIGKRSEYGKSVSHQDSHVFTHLESNLLRRCRNATAAQHRPD